VGACILKSLGAAQQGGARGPDIIHQEDAGSFNEGSVAWTHGVAWQVSTQSFRFQGLSSMESMAGKGSLEGLSQTAGQDAGRILS
jgi:hypothetical protein